MGPASFGLTARNIAIPTIAPTVQKHPAGEPFSALIETPRYKISHSRIIKQPVSSHAARNGIIKT